MAAGVVAVAGLIAAGPAAGAAATASPAPAPSPYVDRVLTDPRITESSGLALSTRDPSVLWTLNDSGDAARLYAVGADGTTRAVLTLAVQARDWEALAAGPEHTLWVGDIGDNRASRSRGILVHRVVEPARLDDGSVSATSYRLVYPDGPHDAEALLVDPRDGRLWVATKGLLGGGLYRAPLPLDPVAPNRLERVADVPGLVTDGTFLPDGRVVLRTYTSAYVAAGPGEVGGVTIALPAQEQGESIAPAPDGAGLLVGSEGRGSQVWAVPLPIGSPAGSASPTAAGTLDTPAPAPTEEPPAARRGAGADGGPAGWLVGVVLAGGGAVVVAAAALLVRRRAR